jgi:hypothetical protein
VLALLDEVPLTVVLPENAVAWATLALLNAGVAQAKGHSRLLWFCASLLLGPIATLLIVVFLDKEESPRPEHAPALPGAERGPTPAPEPARTREAAPLLEARQVGAARRDRLRG